VKSFFKTKINYHLFLFIHFSKKKKEKFVLIEFQNKVIFQLNHDNYRILNHLKKP
ncbi:hypothetical protein GLOIN_2v1621048, partial [Rhizophagus irregularis DAOM 181602=DAOM 197198]